MKKVLFATTALVASAGFAAAEVSLSGSAEIGIFDNGTSDAQFHSDMDVKFSLSGETDNGLTFGATIDLDEVGDDDDVAGIGAGDPIAAAGTGEEHSVFISGGFGTVTMGDTDGALDWAMQEVNLVGGSIQDDETIHAGFNGNAGLDGSNDGQVLRYDYSFGAFAVAASVELDDAGTADDVYAIGFKYDADLGGIALGFGLGYQDGGATFGDITGVSIDADFGNGFVAGLNYSDFSTGNDHLGLGVGYTMDALSIGVNYGEFDTGADGFGLAVNYDLGGAVVQFGYGDSSTGTDTYSLGIAMSF
ncbi:MAG: porin [Pseudomonadota bacterium]|jgi:outer membrane protein OmpU|nr:porin [Pseudomonadota bacterium]